MNKTSAHLFLKVMWAALLVVSGCAQLPGIVDQAATGESPPAQTLAQDIDSMALKLNTVEQRLASLEKEVVLSAQRAEQNQALISKLSAKLSVLEGGTADAPLPMAKSGAPISRELSQEKLYLSAYRAYLSGNYPTAIQGFASYLASYPRSRLADNALYWMGDSYYMLEDLTLAIDHLNRVAKDYPHANKVPYALYRSGLIYYELGDRPSAEAQFRRLMKSYPRSDPARLASIKAEKLKESRRKEGEQGALIK